MGSDARDRNTVAKVACPICLAPVGTVCRNPFAHQWQRGPEDRRKQPARPHHERRQAYLQWKRLNNIL